MRNREGQGHNEASHGHGGYLPSISNALSKLRNSFGVSSGAAEHRAHQPVVRAQAQAAAQMTEEHSNPSGGSLLAQALRGLSFRRNSNQNKVAGSGKDAGKGGYEDGAAADNSALAHGQSLAATQVNGGSAVASSARVSLGANSQAAAAVAAPRRGAGAYTSDETRLASHDAASASPRPAVPAAPAALPPIPFPLSPAGAIKYCRDHLTDYEQSEVLDFPQVYFTGRTAEKTRATVRPGANNHGYDDDRGDYKTVTGDHLAYRYEVQEVLGRGSFGQVLKCLDHKTRQVKAVKIIRNKKRFHQQALIELKLLEHLRHKDPEDVHNVVHIEEYFYFRGHLCISFELLSINLYELIKNGNFQGLSMSLVRRFAIQILVTLAFLKRLKMIHCDLKPENILLRHPNKAAIKVIDYGSSCYEDERMYTYIQSRFYRSPEVLLGLPYDTAIDMWSFGCILAELYTGYPLFHGENEVEQLLCIMEIQGLPPRDMVERSTRQSVFFDAGLQPKIVANSRGKKRRPGAKDLASILRSNDPAFLDFLQGCLHWDPKERLTPEQALAHEWIAEGGRRAAAVANPSSAQLAAVLAAGVGASPAAAPGSAGPNSAAAVQRASVAVATSNVSSQAVVVMNGGATAPQPVSRAGGAAGLNHFDAVAAAAAAAPGSAAPAYASLPAYKLQPVVPASAQHAHYTAGAAGGASGLGVSSSKAFGAMPLQNPPLGGSSVSKLTRKSGAEEGRLPAI